MFTFQLTDAFPDELLVGIERAPQFGERLYRDKEDTFVRFDELQLRPLTYAVLLAYPGRNRDHALARYSRNLAHTVLTMQIEGKPYN